MCVVSSRARTQTTYDTGGPPRRRRRGAPATALRRAPRATCPAPRRGRPASRATARRPRTYGRGSGDEVLKTREARGRGVRRGAASSVPRRRRRVERSPRRRVERPAAPPSGSPHGPGYAWNSVAASRSVTNVSTGAASSASASRPHSAACATSDSRRNFDEATRNARAAGPTKRNPYMQRARSPVPRGAPRERRDVVPPLPEPSLHRLLHEVQELAVRRRVLEAVLFVQHVEEALAGLEEPAPPVQALRGEAVPRAVEDEDEIVVVGGGVALRVACVFRLAFRLAAAAAEEIRHIGWLLARPSTRTAGGQGVVCGCWRRGGCPPTFRETPNAQR